MHLKYNNNSCYIDTVITIITTILTPSYINYLLNSETHILSPVIKNGIINREINTLRKCFKMINNIDAESSNEWESSQMEPIDVIHAIHKAFDIPSDVTIEEHIHDLRDGKITEKQQKKTNFSFNYVITNKAYKINDIIDDEIVDNKGNLIMIKHTELVWANFIMIHVNRNIGVKSNHAVTTTNSIKNTVLAAIIVHIGSNTNSGHYVAYIKQAGMWYLHDDLRDSPVLVGKILDKQVFDNCTDLFYTKPNIFD